jgi:membrane protein YdbS with pleckstrin-like domain
MTYVTWVYRFVNLVTFLKYKNNIKYMNEISQILESSEKVRWEGKPNYAPYITGALFGALIFGAIIFFFVWKLSKSILIGALSGFAIFVISFIVSNLSYTVTHYALTNKRVIFQSGIIGRDFKSINYQEIKNASASVGLLGVIFHVGNINIFTGEIMSTGGKNSNIRPKYDTLHAIGEPYQTLKILQEYLSQREESLYK